MAFRSAGPAFFSETKIACNVRFSRSAASIRALDGLQQSAGKKDGGTLGWIDTSASGDQLRRHNAGDGSDTIRTVDRGRIGSCAHGRTDTPGRLLADGTIGVARSYRSTGQERLPGDVYVLVCTHEINETSVERPSYRKGTERCGEEDQTSARPRKRMHLASLVCCLFKLIRRPICQKHHIEPVSSTWILEDLLA